MKKKQETNKNNKKHHISSGGFIFHKNKETNEIFTLLVKNKKGEYWIPKGHLEAGENQVDAAFREIEEETTLKKNRLKYAGFCRHIKYSFTEDKIENTKEVYINVFEAFEKNELIPRTGDNEIFDIKWFKYPDALDVISFNKDEMISSKEIFEKYLLKNN